MIQLQMIDKTKSIAQNDKNISAVFMYGSFTKNEGDKYSDIEFYIFLKDKEKFSAENWVSQIHPLALYFTNEFGSEVAIFENMIRGGGVSFFDKRPNGSYQIVGRIGRV